MLSPAGVRPRCTYMAPKLIQEGDRETSGKPCTHENACNQYEYSWLYDADFINQGTKIQAMITITTNKDGSKPARIRTLMEIYKCLFSFTPIQEQSSQICHLQGSSQFTPRPCHQHQLAPARFLLRPLHRPHATPRTHRRAGPAQ